MASASELRTELMILQDGAVRRRGVSGGSGKSSSLIVPEYVRFLRGNYVQLDESAFEFLDVDTSIFITIKLSESVLGGQVFALDVIAKALPHKARLSDPSFHILV